MRTLCPNLDREDGLDTVLEVPIPEEIFGSNYIKQNSWKTMKYWLMRSSNVENNDDITSVFGGREAEIQFLLGVNGAPLIPIPITCDRRNDNIKPEPIPMPSKAGYIVQQYIAATGGQDALNSIESMYAMGKVKMVASEFQGGQDMNHNNNKKLVKSKNIKHGGQGQIGGFVLWQKTPDLWSFELVVSGCKISAGSDGRVAWRHTPWQNSHASRGPPRPLRRSLQGLDPRSTAKLFANSIYIGDRVVNEEDCFVLKVEAAASTLTARSSSSVEIIRHTIWGCFSTKTGLLLQLEDTHILRIKAPGNDVLWETTMESLIQDYRTIDGVNIAHGGKTCVSLFRFGENAESHTRTRMEEVWSIEEVDFNIKGLSNDCFLPPADLKKDEDDEIVNGGGFDKNERLPRKDLANSTRTRGGRSRVVAIDEDNLELFGIDEEL